MSGRDWTMLTWSEKTWNERLQTMLAWVLALVLCLVIFVGGLIILGRSIDGIDRYNAEHRRCLKNATNGYEIEQCR